MNVHLWHQHFFWPFWTTPHCQHVSDFYDSKRPIYFCFFLLKASLSKKIYQYSLSKCSLTVSMVGVSEKYFLDLLPLVFFIFFCLIHNFLRFQIRPSECQIVNYCISQLKGRIAIIWCWHVPFSEHEHERAAFQSVAVRLATMLVATLNTILFFSPLSTFLIEGVLRSKNLFAKVDRSTKNPRGRPLSRPCLAILDLRFL